MDNHIYKEKFHGKVAWHGDTVASATVSNFLNREQTKLFRNSVFGSFIDVELFNISGPLVHCLLLCQVNPQDSSGMSLFIGEQLSRFTKYEFSLVTGLKCSHFESPCHLDGRSSRLLREYFPGKKSITVAVLKSFLENKEKKKLFENKNDDAVKLAQIYMLEACLLGTRPCNVVDQLHMVMVEDDRVLNEYCWGNLVFQKTIKYLQGNIMRRDDVHSASMFLEGFPFAFQVWAFERFPFLREFAKYVGERVPRILSWKNFDQRQYRTYAKVIFDAQKEKFPIIEQRENEVVCLELKESSKKKRKLVCHVDGGTSSKQVQDDEVFYSLRRLEEKIDKVDQKFTRLEKKIDQKFAEINDKVDLILAIFHESSKNGQNIHQAVLDYNVNKNIDGRGEEDNNVGQEDGGENTIRDCDVGTEDILRATTMHIHDDRNDDDDSNVGGGEEISNAGQDIDGQGDDRENAIMDCDVETEDTLQATTVHIHNDRNDDNNTNVDGEEGYNVGHDNDCQGDDRENAVTYCDVPTEDILQATTVLCHENRNYFNNNYADGEENNNVGQDHDGQGDDRENAIIYCDGGSQNILRAIPLRSHYDRNDVNNDNVVDGEEDNNVRQGNNGKGDDGENAIMDYDVGTEDILQVTAVSRSPV